jgi:hypothetical protein
MAKRYGVLASREHEDRLYARQFLREQARNRNIARLEHELGFEWLMDEYHTDCGRCASAGISEAISEMDAHLKAHAMMFPHRGRTLPPRG